MSHFKTNSDGTLVDTTPLFASIWLALYYVLRESFNDRRMPNDVPNGKSSGNEG